MLQKHAPLRSKVIRSRPLVPWFNDDIKNARRERRKAERKWRRSGNYEDMMAYKKIKNLTNRLMNEARRQYYQDFINDNSENQRKLFAAANTLMNQGKNNTVLPPCDDKLELANKMGSYFIKKIADIGTKLDVMAQDLATEPPLSHSSSLITKFSKFTALSELEVRKLIESSAKKSCLLDPMPTSLVYNCIDVLLPVITKMINLSMVDGVFADAWKCALVKPLLKKAGLDPLLGNYRPISNLPYISKLTEKAVYNQLHSHMIDNCVYPEMQSSYRKGHSTETALLRVVNDILMKMNSQEVTLLVLLDLSAAFDTVNHDLLENRLNEEIGISDVALSWFKSYLRNRMQKVGIDGMISNPFDLTCGVPQGSCLGPILFIIYASKLFKIIEHDLPSAHCYADDTQLYISFKPNSTSQDEALHAMENCIEKIRKWMIQDKLLVNDSKTELILIGSKQQLSKLQPISISVGNSSISSSSEVKNLGCWLDSNLSMSKHITNVCKSAFFHLHNIRSIKKYLDNDSLHILVHAFITNKLDYCNSLLFGASKEQIDKVQRVQNAAARLLMGIGKYSHITPALKELHWLPVTARIKFKILLFTFKAVHNIAPSYINSLVTKKLKSSYSLRSNDSLYLEPPKGKMLKTFGARSFQHAAPYLWNKLPHDIRDIESLGKFKRAIKTYLFREAFLI